MIFGHRVIWTSSEEFHWELRKGFTLFGYNSVRFCEFLNSHEQTLETLRIDSPSRGDTLLSDSYRFGCYELLQGRLGFYETSMPGSSYRRTSMDFDMERVENLSIGAYVEKSRPSTILLHDGTTLAIEDTAQAVFACLPEPLGLDLDVPSAIVLRAANSVGDKRRPFVDYDKTDFLSKPKLPDDIPAIISDSFHVLADSATRQVFADHASTMALLWVIGHEDAHKYCGHLSHFHALGAGQQDRLFEELAAFIDGSAVADRRSAELQADTCSAMRMVDYCFDSEFLGIITDQISIAHRRNIWLRASESKGLTAVQRRFLMRLIAMTSILPLAVFTIATQRGSAINTNCYPTLLTRALNVIFTVASRSVDVGMNQPNNRTGRPSHDELLQFLTDSLSDLSDVLAVFENFTGAIDPSTSGVDPRELAPALFAVLLAYHGQEDFLALFGLRLPLNGGVFGSMGEPVVEFVRERHAMDLARVQIFPAAQRLANKSRLEKVDEDISIATRQVNQAGRVFSFL